MLLPRLDSGGQRLRVWSGKGKVLREGRLHGGVPEGEVQALAPDRHPHGDRHRVQEGAEGRLGSVAREGDRVGVSVLKYMELKDYTEEQLRAELKRRYDERQKERESIKRCRHCEYMQRFKDYDLYNCRVRTFTRKNRYDKNNPIVVHYSVKKSDKACDKFKQKENQDGK